MEQPLAIVFYERLMPGSQLVNRLQDRHYRVLTVDNADSLASMLQREMPLLLFADLASKSDIIGLLEKIRGEPVTNHLPIIAFAPDSDSTLLTRARQAGVRLAVTESALTGHLAQLLEQALQVD